MSNQSLSSKRNFILQNEKQSEFSLLEDLFHDVFRVIKLNFDLVGCKGSFKTVFLSKLWNNWRCGSKSLWNIINLFEEESRKFKLRSYT